MITLIIKGDMAAAALAAGAHGVTLKSMATHNKFREVIASAGDEHLHAVMRWFCEPTEECEPPYSDGVCTFYSHQHQGPA